MSIDTQQQFESMKHIGRIVANCLELLKARARPGMSTLELDEIGAKYLASLGAISAPKACYHFPGSVCLSHEYVVAHGIPNQTVLQKGDLLNIDVSASLNGFFADNGESIVIGKNVHFNKEKLCHGVRWALNQALKKIRSNCSINVIGKEVEKVARTHGLTIIKNLCGHGVGQSLHEEPNFIPSYVDKRDKRRLQENQVLAIEPFLSLGATWVEEAHDGWSLYHPDYYSAQKEHTIMVTKQRPFIFTTPDKAF
jgi:methionyl aminopeptidase